MKAFYMCCWFILGAGLPLTGQVTNPAAPAVAADVLQKEQAVRAAAVQAALTHARDQVRESDFLRRYAVSSGDVERIASIEKYTKVQRDRAFQDVWSRARPDPVDPNLRWFFLPFPAGLKYVVDEVEQEKSGRYVVSLFALEKTNWQAKEMEGAYPDKTLEEIENAILPGFVHLRYLRIVTAPNAKGAENVQKKQVVASGKWVIPVSLQPGGFFHVDNPIRIYVKDFEHLHEAPETFGPGKPMKDQPPSPPGVADERVVTIDATLLRPVAPDAETAHFLSDWYIDYRRSAEARDLQKKKTSEDWVALYLRYNSVEDRLAELGRTGDDGMPAWSHVWEIEVNGEKHLLLTGRVFPAGREEKKMRVRIAEVLEEFNDEKKFQRTPLVLADLTKAGS